MSLRFRLILLLSILFLGVILAAAVALLSNTQANVGAEARAALGLVGAFAAEVDAADGVSPATVEAISGTRHLRVESGLPRSAASGEAAPGSVPGWFARMVSPVELPAPVQMKLAADASTIVPIEVRAAPGDEIAEAWDDLAASATYAMVLFLVLCAGTSLVVTRELAPLSLLGVALRHVEDGALDTRMPHAALPEIERLSIGFNRMAMALGEAQRTNRELTRRIIGVQESERRALARELHDEFGQHLTAIRADAAALLAPNATVETSRVSGRAIEDTAATLMHLLRSMLERLRPEALDALGLCAALEDLAGAFRSRNCDVVVTTDLPASVDLEEERAIALYRVAQEALTNIARHANAGRVSIGLTSGERLALRIEDDGRGMPGGACAEGFGLLGMRERIDSCGGVLEIGRGVGGRGTSVCAWFPENPV